MNSWIDIVLNRADEFPDKTAYRFLPNGQVKGGEESLCYQGLVKRASAIGTELLARGAAKERVLLIFKPGLAFIEAFFGVLFAGATAVPLQAAEKSASEAFKLRVRHVTEDANANFVLTDSFGMEQVAHFKEVIPCQNWIRSDFIPSENAFEWSMPSVRPESLAFLQYTSGSTRIPKGVKISHENLLANCNAIFKAGYDRGENQLYVNWLPHYHDMGLVGGLIYPIYAKRECVFMPPHSFIRHPIRWIEAIDYYKASMSGGPNFAYSLVAQRSTEKERSKLDLSHWKVAYCGAEPIQASVLRGFAEAFKASGFDSSRFLPCYGMAESTLFIAGRQGLKSIHVNAEKLRTGQVQTEHQSDQTRELTSCGNTSDETIINIVDDKSFQEAPNNRVGEIWVRGPGIAAEYVNPSTDPGTFNRLLGKQPGYFRTGDLGFLHQNELFICGRLKDVIIIRGQNIYPQDIEWTTQDCDSRISRGHAACFTLDQLAEEEFVIVVGLRAKNANQSGLRELALKIKEEVLEKHAVEPKEIYFVRSGEIPKTSSGKIQRSKCRKMLSEGSFTVFFQTANENTWNRLYEDLEKAFEKLDHRNTQYRFDLEKDIAWDLVHQKGRYFSDTLLKNTRIDVDKLKQDQDALDYFEWALALLTCRQFVILEEAVLFWGNVLREVKAETESLFMLESEEKKHIELFKKYSRLLADIKPGVADDLNRIKGIPRKEFLDWVLDPTQYQNLQEYHYTAWLGVLMFEEYTVWIGENLRELKDDVQPTWKQAHACHRREEVQHVRTDYAYIQQLDIRFEERSLWSKKFFQKMIRVFEDEYRELISLVEVKFPHLNAPLMLPPQGEVLTFLKHPIFRRTRSAAPYAELLCSGSEQKTDFSYLPYQNKKELTAWLQVTLANLLDRNEKEISLTDSFSRLGLDSLDHLRLAAALEEKLGQVVPNNIAHEFTNIESLVEHFTDLDLEVPPKSVKQGPIEKRGETKAPVTCKQQRFLQYYDRINASAKNVCFIEWFEQEINLDALKQAFAFVLARHDSLRSVFKKQHKDFWMHILPVDSLDIQIKIYHTEAENLNSLIRDRIIKTNHPGYQVDRPPLWDLIVLKSEKTGMSAFLFVTHQLVCDGWSLEVVRKEMMEAYQAICQNHSFQKPELLFQFTDVALSQAEYLKSAEAGKRLNWWKSHPVCRKITQQNLQQVKPFLTMTDYLASDYKKNIKKVAKQFGVTPGIFLLGIYAKVLRELEGEGFVKFRFLNRINEAERALTGYMVDELLIPRPAADLPMGDVIAHLNQDYQKALENYLPLQYLVKQLFGQELINSRKSIAPVFNFIPFNENSSQKGDINLLADHELYESLPWESKILYLWFARDGVGLSFHFNEEEGKEYGERLISRFLDILGDCIS